MTSSRYWERIEYLEDRIQDRQMLKVAQVQNGPHHQFFQNTISKLTVELRDWESKISEIDRLEADIDAVGRRADSDEEDARNVADTCKRLATTFVLIGAPLLLLSLTWSPSLILSAAGGLLLLLAVIAGERSIKARASEEQIATEAKARLAQLRDQLRALIPPPSVE